MSSTSLKCWHIAIAGVAACGALSIGGYLGIISPVQYELERAAEIQRELDVSRDKSHGLDRLRRELTRQLAEAREQLGLSPLDLKSEDYLNTRLAELDELIESTGMIVHRTRLEDARSGDWYQVVPIQISGLGSYSNCAVFLHRLHERMPDTGIVGFELSGNPATPGAPSTFRFDLVWYAAQTASVSAE